MVNIEMGPKEPEEEIPQEEKINKNEDVKKVSRRGFLKVATGTIIGTSALGKTAEAFAGEKSESDTEEKEREELKKDATYLGERLGEISREGIENINDGLAIKENGDMVFHLGKGIYYVISKSNRSELLKIRNLRSHREQSESLNTSLKMMESGHSDAVKREDFDRAKETLKNIKRANEAIDVINNQADKLISDKIRHIGRRFEGGNAPKELSDFEQKRIRLKVKKTEE
jgi:fructose-1,6-bisphosphatase